MPTRVPLALIAVCLSTTGCAIHYFDAETGTEHIWGFGHMQMKVAPPEEGVQAVVRGTDVLGVSIGAADNQAYLTAGWHRVQRLDVIAESTSVRFEWPTSDFIDVRVGTDFPGVPGSGMLEQTQTASPSDSDPEEGAS